MPVTQDHLSVQDAQKLLPTNAIYEIIITSTRQYCSSAVKLEIVLRSSTTNPNLLATKTVFIWIFEIFCVIFVQKPSRIEKPW